MSSFRTLQIVNPLYRLGALLQQGQASLSQCLAISSACSPSDSTSDAKGVQEFSARANSRGRALHVAPWSMTTWRSASSTSGSSEAEPSGQEPLAYLPPAWKPYARLMRMDKPIGTYLLMYPCFWSIALAAGPGNTPDLKLLVLFGIGSVPTCEPSLVQKCKHAPSPASESALLHFLHRAPTILCRPLASGALRPIDAIGLLAAQLSLGLVILLQLNDFSKILGASSLLLVATYPLMKRITFWPQAFLGLTINWGAILGYTAAANHCDLSLVLPLYASGVCWSLIYDTIYAHQDKRDDVTAGVKSTALLFGDNTKAWLSAFAVIQVVCLGIVGANAQLAWPYYVSVGLVATHLALQIRFVNLNNGPDCMAKFELNKWTQMGYRTKRCI
eukprot:gene9804-7694_t